MQTLTQQINVNDALTQQINVYGAKNILPMPTDWYNYPGDTSRGITFVMNNDGTYSLSGQYTGSGTDGFNFIVNDYEYLQEYAGKEMVMSNTPAFNNGNTRLIIHFYYNGSEISRAEIKGTSISSRFTVPSNFDYVALQIFIEAGSAAFDSSVIYKPMLCLATFYELDPTWEPPAKSNQQLAQKTTGLIDNQNVNGAVNMLPNNATTQVINGVTFTVNSDGTVTANGTATATTELPLYTNSDGSPELIGKTVKLSGCPSGGNIVSTYSIQAYRVGSTDGSDTSLSDLGKGATFTWLNNGTGTRAVIKIIIRNGYTASNLTFKPMLTVPSYDGDYVPYAKSNKELTEDVASSKVIVETQTLTITQANTHTTIDFTTPSKVQQHRDKGGSYMAFAIPIGSIALTNDLYIYTRGMAYGTLTLGCKATAAGSYLVSIIYLLY